MEHLLLFYQIFIYTYGFSLLIFTIYNYVTTKNRIVGSFLFMWSSLTALLASYVTSYYLYINFGMLSIFYKWAFLQFLPIAFSCISCPLLVHRVFIIKRDFVVQIFIIVSLIILILFFINQTEETITIVIKLAYLLVVVSNLYGFIVATKRILILKDRKNKKIGIIFLLTFAAHFIIFTLIDLIGVITISKFVYFPIFYMWIGGFFTILGLKMLKNSGERSGSISQSFVQKYKLTKREVEIASLLVEGFTYKAIAEELCISSNTVSYHVKHIYGKSNTNNKMQLSNEIARF